MAGCIDQQSRLRRLFTAGDGYVDAEFLAERKRPWQTTYRDYWSGHAINCSGIKPAGSGINSCKRASPTLTFTDINRVSELLSVPTKDASRDSFPGDHGMMLLIFSAFMWRYFGKVAGLIALIIFVVFAFPRVMIGAHWFTDIIVGSMTVILIGLPWVLLTPLSDRLITFFDKSLPGKNKHFQNK